MQLVQGRRCSCYCSRSSGSYEATTHALGPDRRRPGEARDARLDGAAPRVECLLRARDDEDAG
eukprot:2213462-Pyramimonas_sp.AAC.1